MSQRCLTFDSEIVCDEKTTSVAPPHFPDANGSTSGAERPVVRARMPGIGLHLNSLSGFIFVKECVKSKAVDSHCESSKMIAASPEFSTGSELMLSTLDNTPETDHQEEQYHGASGQIDESNCIQSSSVDDFSFVVHSKTNQAGRKRLSDQSDIDDGKVKVKRRRRVSSDGCRRCSCKKSKCLKLYCECFASGSFCLETCGCRNCSNKSEHEDVVAETREQIQSRNPLAFIPRVVASATVAACKEESEAPNGLSKHKRGCNCKKSMCLKKYCECYQSEVGCSASCKCVGCANSFGAKQGLAVVSKDREEEPQMDPPIERCSAKEITLGTPMSSSFFRALSSIATEDSSVHQSASTCSKTSSSNFATPLQNGGELMNNNNNTQISSEFSASRTATPEPTYQRRTAMVTRSISSKLPPGIHSLQSKSSPEIISPEDDEFPDFLQDPAETQSATVTNSPKKKRVTPPQLSSTKLPPVIRNGRKLTLQGLPSLPPVSSILESIKVKNQM